MSDSPQFGGSIQTSNIIKLPGAARKPVKQSVTTALSPAAACFTRMREIRIEAKRSAENQAIGEAWRKKLEADAEYAAVVKRILGGTPVANL